MQAAVADQHHAGIVGNMQPFMKIEGE